MSTKTMRDKENAARMIKESTTGRPMYSSTK